MSVSDLNEADLWNAHIVTFVYGNPTQQERTRVGHKHYYYWYW